MSLSLKFRHSSSTGNDIVIGRPLSWEWERNGGTYRKKRDFFWVHWQVNFPRTDRGVVTDGINIVRLHVESPAYDDDPVLNDLKREVIEALWNSKLPKLAQQERLDYHVGRLVADHHIQANRSTEPLHLRIAESEVERTAEENIAIVHEAVGAEVDSVLDRFSEKLRKLFHR